MGIRYKREFPQNLRNYLPHFASSYKKRFTDFTPDLLEKASDVSSVVSKMPIIKATIASYAIENGNVNFKILVTKNGFTIRKIKKQFYEFQELENLLSSKYITYIRQGVFMKGQLPHKEEFNFNNLQSLEKLKDQLKIYLESTSNQPVNSTVINEEYKLGNTNIETSSS